MPATDDFSTFIDTPVASARRHFDVTPHDTNELSHVTAKGILVTASGTLAGILAGDGSDTISFTPAANTWYPLAFKIIKSTGTTATGIKGFY